MPRAAPRPSELPSGAADWRVDDCSGVRIGNLAAVYEDHAKAAAWYLIRLARYSTRFVLAPAADVTAWDGRLALPWSRERIERAPVLFTAPPAVTPGMEDELRRHYGLVEIADVDMTARRSVV